MRQHLPLLLLSAVVPLGACNNPERWTFREEVRLNTGESIVVQRVALRNNVWPRLGNGGYQSVVNQWLSQRELKIEWEAKKDGGTPIAIGIVSGSTSIATVGQAPDLQYCKNHPDNYVVSFWKQVPTGWQLVEQNDALLDQLTSNLLSELEWGDAPDAKPAYLDLKDKGSRANYDFSSPPSIRQMLTKKRSRCVDALRMANWLPLEVVASRASSSASSP